jgi:hypothetical protein
MSVETLEIDDEVTPALISMTAKAQLAGAQIEALRSKISALTAAGAQDLVNEFGAAAGKAAELATQTVAELQAEKSVTAEVQKQISLMSKIATFDAARVKSIHALEHEYEKMRKDAIGAEEPSSGGMASEIFAGASAAGALLSTVSKVKDEIVAISKEVAHLTLEGSKLAVEMSNFKSESLRVFETFTGSGRAAEQMLEQVKALANVTGEAPEAVAGRMKKLLAEGFKPLLAGDILQAQADVFAALGEGEAAKLEGIFEKLHNKGSLDQKTITGLARAGVDTQKVYESLSSHLHKSIAQIKADLKTGAIAGDEAAEAIAAAVEGKFGGAAQKRADNDIFVMFARIRNDARALFEDIDIGPIKEAGKSLIEALEGPGGKELAGGLQDMFGSLFHTLFDPFKGPEGAAKIQLIMHEAANAMHNVADAARRGAPYIRMVVDTIAALSQSNKGDSGYSQFERIAQGLKLILDIGMNLATMGTFGDVSGDIAKLFDLGDIELPDLGKLGGDMIDGLVGGIESGAAKVVDSLVSVCTNAVKAAEGVLGIKSPSRVFHDIGTMTSQGFANGIASNDNAPKAASAAMASGATAAAFSGAPSSGAGGGYQGGVTHVNVTMPPIVIHANDAAGGAEAAAAATPAIQQAHREAAARHWGDMREAG